MTNDLIPNEHPFQDRENPVLAKYWQFLNHFEGRPDFPANPHGPLANPKMLAELLAVLEKLVRPANEVEIGRFMVNMASAWPYAHQKTDPRMLDGFLEQLGQDISKFPADILEQTLAALRQRLTFAPSIAEIYQEASERFWPRQEKLNLVRAHLAERKRREALAAPPGPATQALAVR